ncbi:hypothetical protein [Planomonospora sp. ID82291]|uniref:hypothetical protein n=1 Tax=Planomonospora sp. ID82291 TaxID=2738136 RepID=UPI001E61EE5C|nr:hypothetical protein [Planomonospora sp. ID82291]
MTDEVGVITGDLTVATELGPRQVRVWVQYTGAEEWYEVTGSPLPVPDAADTGMRLHQAIVAAAATGLPTGLTSAALPI